MREKLLRRREEEQSHVDPEQVRMNQLRRLNQARSEWVERKWKEIANKHEGDPKAAATAIARAIFTRTDEYCPAEAFYPKDIRIFMFFSIAGQIESAAEKRKAATEAMPPGHAKDAAMTEPVVSLHPTVGEVMDVMNTEQVIEFQIQTMVYHFW